jgi:prepilin-type N-terminal cleavage/methylation domain-containing protein
MMGLEACDLGAVGDNPAISKLVGDTKVKKAQFVNRARKGFTLLEALFAVLIIAVLAAVAIPLYVNTKADAEKKTCLSNIKAIATAESKYYFNTNAYTDVEANLKGEGLAELPNCPATTTDYTIAVVTASGSTPASVAISCPLVGSTHAGNTMTISTP